MGEAARKIGVTEQRSLQNNKRRMVRPWVEVSLSQYEKLRKLTEKRGRSL